MEKDLENLQKQIEEIKNQIVAIGDLRPGSLSEQYNVCGKENCRCKADPPKKHGPYYQLSYTRKGKSKSMFVRKGKDSRGDGSNRKLCALEGAHRTMDRLGNRKSKSQHEKKKMKGLQFNRELGTVQ